MKRDYTDAVPFPDQVVLRPIARVHAPFTERHGTPRQPGVVGPKERAAAEGTLELLPHVPQAALDDLEGFDRIWILAFLHLNGPRLRPRVRPPRGGSKRGVLATRAPHRPNPLSLSAVRLHRVEGRVLHVSELDLLDGTPVLDIKPYIPDFDAFPHAARGWLGPDRLDALRGSEG